MKRSTTGRGRRGAVAGAASGEAFDDLDLDAQAVAQRQRLAEGGWDKGVVGVLEHTVGVCHLTDTPFRALRPLEDAGKRLA
jgi:hypothetical protein